MDGIDWNNPKNTQGMLLIRCPQSRLSRESKEYIYVYTYIPFHTTLRMHVSGDRLPEMEIASTNDRIRPLLKECILGRFLPISHN